MDKRLVEGLVPITIDYIVPNSVLPADVYFQLSEDNFIVVGRKGTREQFKDLQFYEKLKNAIYVKKIDLPHFSAMKILSAGEVMKDDRISTEQKTSVLSQTLDSVFTNISHLGFNSEALGNSKFIANSVLKIVDDTPKLSSLMTIMSSISTDLMRHSMAVSIMSVLIAQARGWNSSSTLEKMALGALLHDIGLKEYPQEFLQKERVDYTSEDLEYYHQHSFRGVEILKTVENIPQEVMAIVLEHHENAIGQGFPRRLRDLRMHPYAKVVALADSFCELTFKDNFNAKPLTPEAAIQFIEFSLGQPFNKECFAGLKGIVALGVRKPSIKIVS